MLSVTFSQPIVIDANGLAALLSLANAPATVEPYLNGHATPAAEAAPVAKRGSKPRVVAAQVDAAPAGDKPKRTRRTKAEMEAARAEQAAAAGGEAPPTTTEADVAGATTEPPAEAAPVKEAKKPRKPKETKTATAATVAAAEVASTEGLLERFAKLIDSDFTQAKEVLDQFGVNRFSDLKPDDIAAFSAKLVELGV